MEKGLTDLTFVGTEELWTELLNRYSTLFAVGVPLVQYQNTVQGKSIVKGTPVHLLGLVELGKAEVIDRMKKATEG